MTVTADGIGKSMAKKRELISLILIHFGGKIESIKLIQQALEELHLPSLAEGGGEDY